MRPNTLFPSSDLYYLQNLLTVQLKWINTSLPEIFQKEKLWQQYQPNRRPLNHYQSRQSHSAHQDYQKDQQPSKSRPSTRPSNTQHTMLRENYTITQPNLNNQNEYSRRLTQRQGTRAQPEFDENGVPRCNYCKQRGP